MVVVEFYFGIIITYTLEYCWIVAAIKKRMEKDIDEVGKIARQVKAKIEAVNREVVLLVCY